jgi:peptide methionine sulfoxide reductase msrA/msrB
MKYLLRIVLSIGIFLWVRFASSMKPTVPSVFKIQETSLSKIASGTTMIVTWHSETTGTSSVKSNSATNQSPDITVPAWFDAVTWVKPSQQELKKALTSLQYSVTQEEWTEQPFNNIYWDNHEAGIYVDIVSGEPLFSSRDKYDSDTGRPSFTKPIFPSAITTKTDTNLWFTRTEVRSRYANSHLGHVFDDGPQPLWPRYCMNSASLLFIPAKDLEAKWYGRYK